MHTFFMIAAVFVVPLTAISLFILADKAVAKLAERRKNRRK